MRTGKSLPSNLAERVEALKPWFHAIDLGDGMEIQRDDVYGSDKTYPKALWNHVRSVLPPNVKGQRVLDIGCNSGYFCVELKRAGAGYVLGLEAYPQYLEQARLVREILGLDIDLKGVNVYEVTEALGEFDITLFLGVLYHLKNPMLALEAVAKVTRGMAVIETAVLVDPASLSEGNREYGGVMHKVGFIENSNGIEALENWFIPSLGAFRAMVLAAGFKKIVAELNTGDRAIVAASV